MDSMDRREWNNLVEKYAPSFGAFLHSYEWGEFQRSIGREIVRVWVDDEQGLVMAQAIKMDLPFGQFYWYVPKGPFGTALMERQIEVLHERLPGAVFLRVEPQDGGHMLRVSDIQPSVTMTLDLRKSENEIFSELKSKTRYNIRLAEKKGVVPKVVNIKRFEDFMRLIDQTSNRDRFSSHPDAYYQAMLTAMRDDRGAKAYIAMAFYNERPLVGNIMIDFAGVRTYLHGASSNLHRNVMAPYLLHWYLIKDAKRRGFHTFDFWGVAPPGSGEKHPWHGITRYKEGFGGVVVEQPGTFDLPTKHLWYSAYKTVRAMRRIKPF